jgi:hypothetical protein
MKETAMKSQTADTGHKNGGGGSRECLPCEVPAFCRNHYYRGKLLTERDFSDEQRYLTDKHRLHNQALHGWGVVCGLRVKPHPHCPALRVVVEDGFAIDTCGREIRVLREVEIALPKPPDRPPESPHPEPEPPPPGDRKYGEGEEHPDHEGVECGPEDRGPQPRDLYICVSYAECDSEFAPAPFDDCACNTGGQQPNRVCESYSLKLYEEKPDFWDSAESEECEPGDCGRILRHAVRECAAPAKASCIPLAVIRGWVPGEDLNGDQIDNWSSRPTLVSTRTLTDVVRCILDKLPVKDPSRIRDISWQHGERVLCHRFMGEFVGSERHPRGFQIFFDSPVEADPIDTRSFQALVIYRPPDISEPRRMELAPAFIDKEPGQTTWCTLRIDPNYARKHLDGRSFDLYLTLKCNVITGRHGLAVDGDFLAVREGDDVYRMAFPTGDNVPGGAFESWIRVRPRPKGV